MKSDTSSGIIPRLSGVPLLVHTLPYESYGDPVQMPAIIDSQLAASWEPLLSEDEKKEWEAWSTGRERVISPSVFLRLDALILHQAETFGWRLMSSWIVQSRLKNWEEQKNGAELLGQLCRAFVRAARILQGLELVLAPCLGDMRVLGDQAARHQGSRSFPSPSQANR